VIAAGQQSGATSANVSEPEVAAVPLELLEELAHQHHEHEKYYAVAPLREAERVLRAARTLKALAERWRQARVRPPDGPVSPYLACNDLNDPVAVETHGILFLESGGEPAELLDLKSQLRALAEGAKETGNWLRSAMESSWEMAGRTLAHPGLAPAQGERHRIIANDIQAAGEIWLAGLLVQRAIEILETMDLTTAGVRRDLRDSRSTPDYLYSAAVLLDRAADLSLSSTALTRDSEPRWRAWAARLQQLTSESASAPAPREAGAGENSGP
jgi:hypothetical protein